MSEMITKDGLAMGAADGILILCRDEPVEKRFISGRFGPGSSWLKRDWIAVFILGEKLYPTRWDVAMGLTTSGEIILDMIDERHFEQILLTDKRLSPSDRHYLRIAHGRLSDVQGLLQACYTDSRQQVRDCVPRLLIALQNRRARNA